MANDYEAFFARLRLEHPKASFPEAECSTLTSYLNGDIDAQHCAVQITKYTNRRLPVSSKLCIYNLIFHVGFHFEETHEDIVTLIQEIRSIPASKHTGGIDWANEQTSFDSSFRGVYDSLWSRSLDADRAGGQTLTPGKSETSRQWTNINALGAKMQHAGLLDDLMNCLVLIVKVLETKLNPAQVQMNLGASAAWLEFASKGIKEQAAKVGSHTNWADGSDYRKEPQVDSKRMAYWKERLAEFGSVPYISEEVAASCERAGIAIEQALWEKRK